MQSKRDQVQAHRFLMNRLSAAILQGEPDAPSTPMRRFSMGTFGGAMIAVLLIAGSTAMGLLFHGSSTAFREPGAIIVEKETGNRFLLLDGALHPVLNNTSARLLTGGEGHVVSVSAKSLKDLPHGLPVGIPGAPDDLPDPAHLTGNQWLVCSPSYPDPSGAARPALTVLLGAEPTAAPLGKDQGALVRTPDGSTYLAWRDRRFRVPSSATLVALGYGNAQPFPVAAQWLNALAAGTDLVAPNIAGRGELGRAIGDVRARIGQVFVLRTLGSDDTFFVLGPDGLAATTAMTADLLLGDPNNAAAAYPGATARAIEISATVASANATASLKEADSLPIAPPDLVDAGGGPGGAGGGLGSAPCVHLVFDSVQGPTTDIVVVNTGDLPVPPPADPAGSGSGQGVDLVSVAPGSGMLAVDLAAPGVTGGTRYLVTDLGVRYPLPSSDAAQLLGYGSVTPAPVPSTILALLPVGRPLSAADAAVPRSVLAPTSPDGP
jgi:type VII secretion protein EccB